MLDDHSDYHEPSDDAAGGSHAAAQAPNGQSSTHV
jgi:hypothetical protein